MLDHSHLDIEVKVKVKVQIDVGSLTPFMPSCSPSYWDCMTSMGTDTVDDRRALAR